MRQPDGVGAEIGADKLLASGGRVAFIEDEVDGRQNCLHPPRHVAGGRHRIGNASIPDLALGTDQPLRHGRFRYQKGARDLFRFQAAQCTQR